MHLTPGPPLNVAVTIQQSRSSGWKHNLTTLNPSAADRLSQYNNPARRDGNRLVGDPLLDGGTRLSQYNNPARRDGNFGRPSAGPDSQTLVTIQQSRSSGWKHILMSGAELTWSPSHNTTIPLVGMETWAGPRPLPKHAISTSQYNNPARRDGNP